MPRVAFSVFEKIADATEGRDCVLKELSVGYHLNSDEPIANRRNQHCTTLYGIPVWHPFGNPAAEAVRNRVAKNLADFDCEYAATTNLPRGMWE